MNLSQSFIDMRNRRMILLIGCAVGLLMFIIHLKHEIYTITAEKDALLAINEELNIRLEKVINLKTIQTHKNSALPIIYAITPTYKRYEQKAELTRISQTLALVPNVHWIIIEDAAENSKLVTKLLQESSLIHYTHLSVKTPWDQQLRRSKQRWTKHRGVEQRNLGLKWLRENKKPRKDTGVVYFMDDDNTYNIKIFKEMTKIKKVGIWPVGLVGGLSAEQPIVDKQTGRVTGYRTGWKPERAFATDMAGFAINLSLILENPNAVFSYKMEKGNLESDLLSLFITKDALEPLADNCTKVYVWHTRTEKTKVTSEIPDLEV